MNPTATIGQPGDPAAVRSLTFDDVVATYVVDGVLTMRPETFFPATPRQGWDHLCTPAGELVMSAGGLLVQLAGTTVLIDAGVGMVTSSFTFGGDEIVPGMHALITPGHTPGHTSYVITSQTGRRLLDLVSEPDTIGFGCHFGDQPFGRVAVDSAGQVAWEPIESAVLAPLRGSRARIGTGV